MFLAGDEFGNTKYGNNNSYCQDNEMSWVSWELFEKNKDLFEFFKFMIDYRKKHPIIRKKLPEAVCGMEALQKHDINADNHEIPDGARTIGISMAGYNREEGKDDIIYIAVNTFWEDVEITLPKLQSGAWRLSVDTYGDKKGKYFYEEGKEPRMGTAYRMKPRTVAVFTKRDF